MKSLGDRLARVNELGRGALKASLKASFRAVGIPPSTVRERVDQTKQAIKERARRFVLLPEQFQTDGAAMLVAPELERLSGQLAVLRQQQAAARTRITQLEAVNADVVRLMNDVIARLRMLDLKQAEAFASLLSTATGEGRAASSSTDDEPLRRTASRQ